MEASNFTHLLNRENANTSLSSLEVCPLPMMTLKGKSNPGIAQRNVQFTGRREILAELERKLQPRSKTSSLGAVCLSGKRGIGKTAIALEFCYRHEKEFSFIVWLSANSSVRLLVDLWGLAEALGVDARRKGALKAKLLDSPGWLIVLDDMYSEAFTILKDYLPRSGGSLLITTRESITRASWIHSIAVPGLEECAKLLGKVIGSKRPADFKELKEKLATSNLGQLPLAVTLAGSYIRETNSSISTYLERFQESTDTFKKKLQGVKFNDPEQVLAACCLSMDYLKKESEETFHLLSICCVLGTTIQDTLLYFAEKSKDIVEEGKRLLFRFSMLDQLPSAVKIHSLVQESFLINASRKEKILCFSNAAKLLEASFDLEKEESTPLRECSGHCDSVLAKFRSHFAEQSHPGGSTDLDYVYKTTSSMLHESCGWLRIPLPRPFLDACIKTAETVFGARSLVTANVIRNVASALGDQKELDKEKEMLENLLQNLEPGASLEVAKTLTTLAGCYLFLGDVNSMKEAHEKALKILESENDQKEIAKLLVDICACYRLIGEHQREKELLEHLLKIYKLAKNHNKVFDTMLCISNCYQRLEDFLRSKEVLEKALEMLQSMDEAQTTKIAKVLALLGVRYGDLENHQREKEMLEKALEMYVNLLGENHVEVAGTMVDLSSCYGTLENYPKQKELLEKALRIYESAAGDNRLHIAKTINNLGVCYARMGNYHGQVEMFERALLIKENLFGGTHPEVGRALLNLAGCFATLRDHNREKELLERALKIFLPSGGNTELALTLLSLGRCHHSSGDFQGSIATLEKAVEILERSFQVEYLCQAYRALAASLVANYTKTSEIRNLLVAKRYMEKERGILTDNRANPVLNKRMMSNLVLHTELELKISEAQRRQRCTIQ